MGLTPIILAAFLHYFDVVDFLLERNEISRIEKIGALELAGATILFNTRLTHFFPRGLEYWCRSLHLQRMDTDGCGPIIKSLSENLTKAGRIVGDRNEWTTPAQLEYTIQHRYEQEIQSFLIKSRILSTKKWGAIDYIVFLPIFQELVSKAGGGTQIHRVAQFVLIYAGNDPEF